MTSASFEKMPPAVLSREYVTYLEKKKLLIFINEGWKGVNLG